ncbi:MAG TPA: tetratricopeptide repeat protein [Terracidiphilus sp.]|nr:tetratricopeptide repeat protein [Terracidiphilus sp.]
MPASQPYPFAANLTQLADRFQRALARNPHNAEALVGISLVALVSGQTSAAVAMAQAAVAAGHSLTIAWIMLGQALKSAGRTVDAAEAYSQAVALDGLCVLAHTGLGELHLAAGDAGRALAEYDLALRSNPALAAAHVGRGHALAWLRNYPEALACYEQALVFSPRLPEAEFACGFILARQGKRAQAVTRYRRAVYLRPDFAAAWMNLGCLLRDEGQDLFAHAALERAVQLRPDMIAGWLNLALVERDRDNIAKAEECLRRALSLDPANSNTLVAWGQFRLAAHDLPGAWDAVNKALAHSPDNPEAVNMKGILLHTEDRLEEAVAAFLRAEALGCLSSPSNRGNSLMDLGQHAESLAAHQLAAAQDPHNAGSAYNLALTELRLGEWQQGWPRYEARLRFREVVRNPMHFQQPRWQGEPLADRRILLHAEQGLGDAIQFCRYAPLVAARGGSLILQVHQPVVRLLQSLAVVRSGQAVVIPLGAAPPPFDLECPLMSLPAIFATTVDTVPWAGAYLAADPALAAEKRACFSAQGLRVGIAWAGNPRYRADRRRSMQLSTLLPLLRAFGADWVSLQKGEAADQLTALPADLPYNIHIYDGSSRDADLAETAALVETLDLVITTDTSIAHLAGAMGKPVWILLSHLADWRWMQDTDTSPWYPTARLFRQSAPGDWPSVFARVVAALTRFTSSRDRSQAAVPTVFTPMLPEISRSSGHVVL